MGERRHVSGCSHAEAMTPRAASRRRGGSWVVRVGDSYLSEGARGLASTETQETKTGRGQIGGVVSAGLGTGRGRGEESREGRAEAKLRCVGARASGGGGQRSRCPQQRAHSVEQVGERRRVDRSRRADTGGCRRVEVARTLGGGGVGKWRRREEGVRGGGTGGQERGVVSVRFKEMGFQAGRVRHR